MTREQEDRGQKTADRGWRAAAVAPSTCSGLWRAREGGGHLAVEEDGGVLVGQCVPGEFLGE